MFLRDYKVVHAYIALFDLYVRKDKPEHITTNQWCDNIIRLYPKFTNVYTTCMNTLITLQKHGMATHSYMDNDIFFDSNFEKVPNFWDVTNWKKGRALYLPKNCYHHIEIEDGITLYEAQPPSTPLPFPSENEQPLPITNSEPLPQQKNEDGNLKNIILQLISAIENISADVTDIKKTVEGLKRDNLKNQKVENLLHALRDLNGGIDG